MCREEVNHSPEYTRLIDEQSAEWQAVRAKRMAIDDCSCVYCGRPLSKTRYGQLAVHHVRYGENLLDLHDLVTVCGACHGIEGGHLKPWKGQYDPTTEKAKKRFEAYMKMADDYIDGKTKVNNGLFLDYVGRT